MLLGGCGGDGGGAVEVPTGSTTPPGVPAVTTVPVDTQPGGDSAPSNTVATVDSFTMPDVVGLDLQSAQDQLQALGSYRMDQRDATGKGRTQVEDDNWRVCSQRPAAGRTVPARTLVLLKSVPLEERCP
jgi:hypothetical protein